MSERKSYNVSVREAMDALGVSRRTVYRKIKAGELDAKKVATDQTVKWMIKEDDLYQSKMIQDSVNIEEVKREIPKEELMNELVERISSKNREAVSEVSSKLDHQNDLLAEIMDEVLTEILQENRQLRSENERLRRKMSEGVVDIIKNIFR